MNLVLVLNSKGLILKILTSLKILIYLESTISETTKILMISNLMVSIVLMNKESLSSLILWPQVEVFSKSLIRLFCREPRKIIRHKKRKNDEVSVSSLEIIDFAVLNKKCLIANNGREIILVDTDHNVLAKHVYHQGRPFQTKAAVFANHLVVGRMEDSGSDVVIFELIRNNSFSFLE